MKEIVVLQEEPGAGPGLFAAAAEKRGVVLRTVEAARGDRIPEELPPGAGLIVLGGRMTVSELERCPYLVRWMGLLRWAIDARRPILGVGAGAQLFSRALGGRIYPAPEPEFGWGTVTLTEAGIADPLFAGLPVYLPVFQWHGETFDLPPGSAHLARSRACPGQAFRHGESAYGVQFHLEATEAMARAWCAARLKPIEEMGPEERRRFEDPFLDREALARRADRFFGNFLELSGPRGV